MLFFKKKNNFYPWQTYHKVEEPVTKGQVEGGGRRPEKEEEVTKFLGKTVKPDHKFTHVIGICPDCGRRTRVKSAGVMGSHKLSPKKTAAHCTGEGKLPSKIVARYDW